MGLNIDDKIDALLDRLSLVDTTIKKSDTVKNVIRYIEAGKLIDEQIKSLDIELCSINRKIKDRRNDGRQVKETSDILLNHGPNRISLILKNQSGNDYIKARCYWRGKQREVQIGPLSGIVDQLSSLSLVDVVNISPDVPDNITWDICRSDPDIYKAILSLARIKFQRYIVDRIEEPSVKDISPHHASPSTMSNNAPADRSAPEKSTWYESWRERTQG